MNDDEARALLTAELLGSLLSEEEIEALLAEPEGLEAFAEAWQFSEDTDFSAFEDSDDPLRPLPPEQALEWFRRRVPIAGITAKDLTDEGNKKFFTLAVDADAVLLSKVKSSIRDVIETGKDVSATPRTIAKLLEEAGVTQTVGGRTTAGDYPSMVFRTNLQMAYQEGAAAELKEVESDFPCWRWVGIRDGRERASHARFFDKYFPSSVTMADVRDKNGFDGFNERCDFIPIYVSEWRRLQAAGAMVETDW